MKIDTYIIEYEVHSKDGAVLKSGKIRVKNKETSIHAQVSLEEYLKRKVSGFDRLIVKSCKEENINNIFKDMFGDNNPFGF